MTFSFALLSIFSDFMAVDWLIYGALALLAFVQIGLLLRKKSLPKKRLRIRLGLNMVLWVLLLCFVIQPQWRMLSNTERVLLLSENIPTAIVQKTKDSLKITETFSIKDFNRRVTEDPDFVSRLGTIYLAGQDFTPRTLSQLSTKELHWLPVFRLNELQGIRWKAILRKGEFQEVTGQIELSAPRIIKISYGKHTLDSMLLSKGLGRFQLRFPSFAVGRTQTVLQLGEQPLHKLTFYSRKPASSVIHFVLQSPDFESKTLAEWLGKNGNQVEMTATIAQNTQTKVSINRSGSQKAKLPDIVITDPPNVGHPIVKKALADGKSVFFYNITNPEPALKRINSVLGTKWHVKKISNEESRSVGNGITALPYELEPNSNQTAVEGYPVAIQKIGSRVGVSLLNETFSLKLSGDSLTYAKIWSGILQQLNPPFEGNIVAAAPLLKDTKSQLVLNKYPEPIRELTLAHDTARVYTSGLNSLSASAEYTFRKPGWQPFQDSLEVYVEANQSDFVKAEQIREVIQAHNHTRSISSASSEQLLDIPLPDWIWLLLFLISLTVLWLEPKLKW
ncbi:MAG: hypothetical protein U0X91_10075 [Spirosomataceae bacterium]